MRNEDIKKMLQKHFYVKFKSYIYYKLYNAIDNSLSKLTISISDGMRINQGEYSSDRVLTVTTILVSVTQSAHKVYAFPLKL